MKKQFLFLVLLGLLCSVGNVWAYPTTIWESDMQESITGVTQTKGRGSDTWAENTGLSWASSSTYPKRFNAGGSSSAMTFEFNESKSVNANTVIRVYWGATSNRTFSLFINNGESAVATQSSSPNSVVKTLEYEFTGDLSLSSFKIAVSGSSAYFFRVEIVDLGPKPTIGSTTISYALTANANVVAGSTDNRMGTISNFSTSFAVSTLSITSGNSKDGYSGQITGHAADYSASQYVALSFDVASGYVFTPSSVGITIFANSTSNMKAKVELTDGVTSVTSNELSCASSADSDIEFADGAFTDKKFEGTVTVKIYQWGVTSKRAYIKSPVEISGTVAVAPSKHTVTYALGTGATGTTPTESDKYEGETFKLHNGTTNITAPEGKEFAGWSDGTNTYAGGAVYTMGSENVTLTAQWRDPLPKYSVTYSLNGASGDAPTETDKAAGDVFTLAETPSWTGYRFDGWLCNIDDVTYDAEAEYTMTGAVTTFTAQWTELEVKIYSLTGGIGSAVVSAGDEEVSATLLKLSNSAARIKLTPATGETFKSGDIITIGGYTGNASKKLGVYVKNAAGSSDIATAEVATLGDFTVSAILSADAEYVFLARKEGTTMNITTCEILRPWAVGTDADLAYGSSEVETDANAVFTNPLTNANNLVIAGYKSSDTDVATVNAQTGQVTVVGVGETTITAYSAIQTKSGTIYATGSASYTLTTRPQVSGTISLAGWSTFASSYPLDLSKVTATSGASAYYASAANGSTVALTPTGDVTVPAGEGLMIKGTAGETFTIDVAASGTAIDGNLLKGQATTGNVAASPESGAGTYHYVFGYKEQESVVTEYGFYNLAAETSVPAGKAYLELTVQQNAPSIIRIVDEENNATSIEALGSTEKAVKFIENGQLYILREGVVYDAVGRRVR